MSFKKKKSQKKKNFIMFQESLRIYVGPQSKPFWATGGCGLDKLDLEN